ncbi:kinase-like domain-containing protein [Cyathus striatus]|nr:kinase-like domain-containing protein [Cyathus striatus]
MSTTKYADGIWNTKMQPVKQMNQTWCVPIWYNLPLLFLRNLTKKTSQALDSQWLHADVQKRLLVTTLKLSNKSSLYPKCLTLEGVTVEESAVTAGHFGEIWKGSFQGHAVCLKVVKVYQRSRIDDLLKAFSKEGIIWGHLCHENVLPFYGIYHLSDACGRICLTSPWMESGNVTEHLKRNPDANRIHLVLDAIEGISYLHDSGVIHGDLKGANILISPRGRACLADFGLSTVVDAEIVRWTSLDSSSRMVGLFDGTRQSSWIPKMKMRDRARRAISMHFHVFAMRFSLDQSIP